MQKIQKNKKPETQKNTIRHRLVRGIDLWNDMAIPME
jgi:hypothetical protein